MRVCMIGCRWFLDDIDGDALPLDMQFKHAGKNSGNLFIGEAVKSHLQRLVPNLELEHFAFDDIRNTPGESLKERFDCIVMAGSNLSLIHI